MATGQVVLNLVVGERLPLTGLPLGCPAQVVSIAGAGTDPVARRLADLGFLAGTPVTPLRRAPMGGPTIFRLRNYQMCLRRDETDRVLVQISGD